MDSPSILIVEDDPCDQFLIKKTIELFDPDICTRPACDGAEALEVLPTFEDRPLIILLDINMPGMNGFEFLEAYRHRRVQHHWVAMLTTSERQDDRDRATSYAAVRHYFVKNLSAQHLAEVFQQCRNHPH